MNRKKWKAAVFLLGGVLFVGAVFPPGNVQVNAAALTNRLLMGSATGKLLQFEKSYEEKLAEANKRKEELERKKQAVAAQIRENEQKKADLLDYIAELDLQIMQLNDEIEGLDADILAGEKELEQTKINLSLAQETEAQQYEAMKRRIQYMYENGEGSIFELLLGATSLAEVLNRVEYQKEITDYDKQFLAKYT
ncbi:MAG: hypothetical protein K2N63_12870, partial [Lachnospiraceae bacterium]|nr:hypothetical protein [Lachnospiraceae bacterium]